MDNEDRQKAFIDLPEFVCLSYLGFLSSNAEKAELVTSVLCANGYELEEIFKYAGNRGYLDPESKDFIGEKSDFRQYYFVGRDCRGAAKNSGIGADKLWAMCTNCARSPIGYNVYEVFERNLIGSTYRKILNNEKPEKLPAVKMTSVLSVLYEDQGTLKSYVNREYGGKVYSYLCNAKNRFSKDLRKDSADIAAAILGRDRKGYGVLSESEKHSISETAFKRTERMLGRECTDEELSESISALSTERGTGIFTQAAFRNAYKSDALFSKEGYGRSQWGGNKPAPAAVPEKSVDSGLERSEPVDIEEHVRLLKGKLGRAESTRPELSDKENGIPKKGTFGYQYSLSDYQADLPSEKTEEPETVPCGITFDDNIGIIFSGAENELLCCPETRIEAGRYIGNIHDSITVSIEAAVFNEEEGLLFCSSLDGKPVFLRREILNEEILQNVFDGKKYTLFSMNSVPVRKYAWDYGIVGIRKLISLSAMYHVSCDDDRIYPAGYFLKMLGSDAELTAQSFLTELLPFYAKIDVMLFSEIVSAGKEKESVRLNLYEEVLASSYALRQISKINCCPLRRKGYTENGYELPSDIEKTKGGSIIKCCCANEGGAPMDFDFLTNMFVKLFKRPPFSSMNIRWSVLKLSETEIYLWTHLKNSAGVGMIKEAMAIAIADTARKLKREPYEIYFETD